MIKWVPYILIYPCACLSCSLMACSWVILMASLRCDMSVLTLFFDQQPLDHAKPTWTSRQQGALEFSRTWVGMVYILLFHMLLRYMQKSKSVSCWGYLCFSLRGRDRCLLPSVRLNLLAPPFPIGWFRGGMLCVTLRLLITWAVLLWAHFQNLPPDQSGYVQGTRTHKNMIPPLLVLQYDLCRETHGLIKKKKKNLGSLNPTSRVCDWLTALWRTGFMNQQSVVWFSGAAWVNELYFSLYYILPQPWVTVNFCISLSCCFSIT